MLGNRLVIGRKWMMSVCSSGVHTPTQVVTWTGKSHRHTVLGVKINWYSHKKRSEATPTHDVTDSVQGLFTWRVQVDDKPGWRKL